MTFSGCVLKCNLNKEPHDFKYYANFLDLQINLMIYGLRAGFLTFSIFGMLCDFIWKLIFLSCFSQSHQILNIYGIVFYLMYDNILFSMQIILNQKINLSDLVKTQSDSIIRVNAKYPVTESYLYITRYNKCYN